MKRQEIKTIVLKAWRLAENRQEGSIVLQLHPSNKKIVTSWQLGNSWESMGLNATESEDRILYNFDCRDYEPMYWDGTRQRMDGREQNKDNFDDVVNDVVYMVKRLKK